MTKDLNEQVENYNEAVNILSKERLHLAGGNST